MASHDTRPANGQVSGVGLSEVTASAPFDQHQQVEHLEAIRESENQSNEPITPTKPRRKSMASEHRHPTRKPVNIAEPLDGPATTGQNDDVSRRSNDQNYHVSSVTTKFFTIGYLALFSILGTLARLGLQALTSYPQAPLSQGLVWANFAGCFIMGYLSEERTLFREEWGPPADPKAKLETPAEVDAAAERKRHSAVKKTIPLFIGLATGFCGSFTSFSSFQRDVFLNLANSVAYEGRTYPVPRDGGYSFLALLAALIITPCLSLAALSGGAHFALLTERFTPTLPFVVMRGLIDPFLSFLGFGCWFGAVMMAIWPPDRPHGPANPMHHKWERETWRGQAIFALVFAPLGAITRYYVSMWLNPRVASFPLGTFTCNMFGTLWEAVFFDLQHAPLAGRMVGGGIVGCQVLQGVQDGFCGCLTTVSTWVTELKALRKAHAYVYGLVSLLVGFGIMVIIMGSLRWTQGFASQKCVVG